MKELIADLSSIAPDQTAAILKRHIGTGALRSVNNSTVGTSKLLHFFSPNKVPIWDSVLAKSFGLVHEYQWKREDRFLYLSETAEEARSSLPLLGGKGAVCELTCTGIIHRADSRLMVKASEPLSVTMEKTRAYWRGESSADPRVETLFVGDAEVTGCGL